MTADRFLCSKSKSLFQSSFKTLEVLVSSPWTESALMGTEVLPVVPRPGLGTQHKKEEEMLQEVQKRP